MKKLLSNHSGQQLVCHGQTLFLAVLSLVLLQFVVQLLMFAAPVVWPASLVPERFRLLYGLYPMAGVIEGFRSSLLGHNPMPWDLIIMGSVTAVVLFVSGSLYFRRMERIFADVA